jgi:two-component system, sensor histidine kinase
LKEKEQHIEVERLKSLDSYELLDTEVDPILDSITNLVSILCDTPICLISLVDKHRQWFKSRVGLEAKETSRDLAFCHYAIQDENLMEVEDAWTDSRFKDNPLVTGDPNIRFYAGMPLINADGYALGTLCVIDRKPRQLTENQRKTLNVFGKFVITYFDKELQEKKTSQGMKIKEELLSLVSKEMREPMNNIMGMLDLIDKKELILNKELEILKTSTNQLHAAVSELLNFKDIDNVNERISPSFEFSLPDLANELRASVKSKYNVPMSVIHDSNLPVAVLGDPLGLRLALNKLIEFSIEKMKAHKFILSIEVFEDDGTNLEVEISVLVYNNQELNALGSNYKLIVTSELVARMGSKLKYTHDDYYNFTFNVNFKKSSKDNGKILNVQNLVGMRALIVDDMIMNRFVAGKFLTKWGMYYNEAVDGEEAVDMFMNHQYDIILMDLDMPNVNGYDAIRMIRSIEKNTKNRIPIIAVTNLGNSNNVKEIKDAGADDSVLKPFNPNELIQVIQKQLIDLAI